jgi:hypothetical protein
MGVERYAVLNGVKEFKWIKRSQIAVIPGWNA